MSSHAFSARNHGIQLLKKGSLAESIEYLQQALDEDPSDVELYMYLGLAYAKQDEFYKTIDILENAVDLAPTSAQIHYNLGVAYHKVHNLTQAKDEYLRALGLDPSYTVAKTALDSVLDKMSVSDDGSTEA
ncbi:MAG: tetratricopeptide repeat protein [Armatimonadota bacterium]